MTRIPEWQEHLCTAGVAAARQTMGTGCVVCAAALRVDLCDGGLELAGFTCCCRLRTLAHDEGVGVADEVGLRGAGVVGPTSRSLGCNGKGVSERGHEVAPHRVARPAAGRPRPRGGPAAAAAARHSRPRSLAWPSQIRSAQIMHAASPPRARLATWPPRPPTSATLWGSWGHLSAAGPGRPGSPIASSRRYRCLSAATASRGRPRRCIVQVSLLAPRRPTARSPTSASASCRNPARRICASCWS
eukprot:COSAG01_NODE_1835_length_9084_cov_87.179481_13_plen_245_part_00